MQNWLLVTLNPMLLMRLELLALIGYNSISVPPEAFTERSTERGTEERAMRETEGENKSTRDRRQDVSTVHLRFIYAKMKGMMRVGQ